MATLTWVKDMCRFQVRSQAYVGEAGGSEVRCEAGGGEVRCGAGGSEVRGEAGGSEARCEAGGVSRWLQAAFAMVVTQCVHHETKVSQ